MSDEQQRHRTSLRFPSDHASHAGQHARFTGEIISSDRPSLISPLANNNILQPLNEERRTGNFDYVPPNHPRTLGQVGYPREESWMDFLRSTGGSSNGSSSQQNMLTGSSTSESIPDATSRLRPLSLPGSGLSRNLNMSMNMNMPHLRSEITDRKRRTMASEAQPSRRNSSHRWTYSQGTEPRRSFLTERRAYPAQSYTYGQAPLPRATAGLHRQNSSESGSRGLDGFMQGSGAQGDIALPMWQPDSDVSECFVCGTQFSFFFRKHHCRKCGRVVCANCSPHRITIPTQFIVQPNNPGFSDTATRMGPSTPGTTEDEASDFDSAVSGGEEVRVCNPCVPDPNLSPLPQQQWPQFVQLPNPQSNAQHYTSSLSNHTPQPSMYGAPQIHNYLRSDAFPQFPDIYPDWQSRLANQIQQGSSASAQGSFWTPSLLSNRNDNWFQDRSNPDNLPYFPLPEHVRPHPGVFRHTRGHRSEGSSSLFGGWEPYQLPPLNINAPLPPLPSTPLTSTPLPPKVVRREIPEEDECPVCGNELPERGQDGSETAREAHVQDCIGAHFVGPSSSSSAPEPALNVQQRGMNNSAINQTLPPPLTSSSSTTSSPNIVTTNTTVNATAAGISPPNIQHGEQTAPRPRRVTGTRMLTYRATEKDCSSVEGTTAECVICFEEYEVGDEMGRLECLCRFHKKADFFLRQIDDAIIIENKQTCIRGWWDVKGYGSCPTHQIHD